MREQITLGRLIEALGECHQEAVVGFDFAGMRPGELMSYRGYYDQLAIEPESPRGTRETETVAQFTKRLHADALDEVFTGYKGGDYQMRNNTPVWVAFYGSTGDTAVVGVRNDEYRVVIETEQRE